MASPALTPPPGNPRFPLMDALRGLAALAIVVGHSYDDLRTTKLAGHGYADNLSEGLAVGVQVFFALSGFLLFRPALAALARGDAPPRALVFLRRRALRILPAYWFALTVCGLLIPHGAQHVFGHRWWVFYFFGQAYSLTDDFNGLAVAWTLSVEVSFYLTLPVLVAAATALARRVSWERAAWTVIVPLLVLGPVVHALDTIAFSSPDVVVAIQKITYGLPGEANFFAVGMALAVLSVAGRVPRAASFPTRVWGVAAAIFGLVALCFCFTHPYLGLGFRVRFIGTDLLAMAFTALVLLPAAFDVRPGVPRSLLSWPPLVFVGVVSYGLYLWHVPLETWALEHVLGGALGWDWLPRVLTTLVVVLVPSLIAATLSYYVVELPFLRRK